MHIGQHVSITFYLLKKLFLPFCKFAYEWCMFSKLRRNKTKQSLGDFSFLDFVGNLLSACSSLSQFSWAVFQI